MIFNKLLLPMNFTYKSFVGLIIKDGKLWLSEDSGQRTCEDTANRDEDWTKVGDDNRGIIIN